MRLFRSAVLWSMSATAVLSLLVTTTFADHLEVRRSATIKADPHRDATILVRPDVGSFLELLDGGQQDSGYYRVRLPGGLGSGWIYRTLVRRHRGPMPGAPTFPGTTTDNVVEVMWWNIRNLTSNSRTDQELSFIAQVMIGMDVVAIGELEDPNVLPRLTTLLGPSWVVEG